MESLVELIAYFSNFDIFNSISKFIVYFDLFFFYNVSFYSQLNEFIILTSFYPTFDLGLNFFSNQIRYKSGF